MTMPPPPPGQPYPAQPQPYSGQPYGGPPYPGPKSPAQPQPYPGPQHPGQPYPGQQHSTPAVRGANLPAVLAAIFACAVLLWELAQGIIGQVMLRTDAIDAYQLLYGVGGIVAALLALVALILGIVGALRKTGRTLLAGVGIGVGAYVLVLSLFWFVAGALPF